MQIKLGLRQTALSTMVFGGMLLCLISLDARVRERVSELFAGGSGVASLGDRASDLFDTMMSALRVQSIENGPFMVFAVISAVLFLVMLKS